MSFQHHGKEPEPAKDLEVANLIKRFEDQVKILLQGAWPDGRSSADDDGVLAAAIFTDVEHERIRLDFGKPVTWLSMTPAEAVEFAQELIRRARMISKEPIVIKL